MNDLISFGLTGALALAIILTLGGLSLCSKAFKKRVFITFSGVSITLALVGYFS